MKKINSYDKLSLKKRTELRDSMAYKPQFAMRDIIFFIKMVRANAVTNSTLIGGCIDYVGPANNFCPFI